MADMDATSLAQFGIKIVESGSVPRGTVLGLTDPLITDDDPKHFESREELVRWLAQQGRITVLSGFSEPE